MRLALGASRWRLTRQFGVESALLIAMAGGIRLGWERRRLPARRVEGPDMRAAHVEDLRRLQPVRPARGMSRQYLDRQRVQVAETIEALGAANSN